MFAQVHNVRFSGVTSTKGPNFFPLIVESAINVPFYAQNKKWNHYNKILIIFYIILFINLKQKACPPYETIHVRNGDLSGKLSCHEAPGM